jgi:hypothetical protein
VLQELSLLLPPLLQVRAFEAIDRWVKEETRESLRCHPRNIGGFLCEMKLGGFPRRACVFSGSGGSFGACLRA